MNQVLDKKWEVSDVFDENIDWNGMTAVDWSLDKANKSKLTTSPSPKKRVESNKPQEVHFFFDLNLDSTPPNDFERNQSQQQTQPSDSTQPEATVR
uniref:Uncharacterized protein n=1 Tax=Ditylenchus dipsaci TaxID=166011 RepID=A0A915CKU4_9BILA